MILSHALILTLTGLALASIVRSQWRGGTWTLLFEVKPADPLTLGSIPAVLLGVALLAALSPATRATKVDPMKVLRYE